MTLSYNALSVRLQSTRDIAQITLTFARANGATPANILKLVGNLDLAQCVLDTHLATGYGTIRALVASHLESCDLCSIDHHHDTIEFELLFDCAPIDDVIAINGITADTLITADHVAVYLQLADPTGVDDTGLENDNPIDGLDYLFDLLTVPSHVPYTANDLAIVRMLAHYYRYNVAI